MAVLLCGGESMQQSCKWCGRLHPLGLVCPRRPQPHRKNTAAQRFRNTSQWKQTRARVNERDAHLCRLCLLEGKMEHEGLSTHHIIPLEETMDHACDDDWCITLCDGHHKAADRGEYSREHLHRLAQETPRLPDLGG